MNIHQVIPDADNYQIARPGFGMAAWTALSRQLADFEPAGSRWKPGLFQWTRLRKARSTFFSTGDPTLIGVTHDARRSPKLWAELERTGELLPITIEGYGEALIFRILRQGGALDEQKSTFQTLPDGSRVVANTEFRPDAFLEDGFVRMKDAPLMPLCVEEVASSVIRREYVRCGMTGLGLLCMYAKA